MLVSFDIKFIWRDQKHCKNGKAFGASWTRFWSSLINLISKNTYMFFYLPCITEILKGVKSVKQVKSECSFS